MKKKAKAPIKAAASLVIHEADEFTERGRKDVANWLRRQASALLREGANYSKRYTARYLYRDE